MVKSILHEMKQQSDTLRRASTDELRQTADQLKKRAQAEGLETILSPWFALVREMSDRTLGLRHFDRQVEAGYYLHTGKIVEMKTGEGKTLAATLPVSLNAVTGRGVHVVTVNDYLAERDSKTMGKLYQQLGLTGGLVQSTTSLSNKQQQYAADITYLTNSDLVFDYLRDNSASRVQELVQRPFHFCVIDEIDSVLIDEARTPLILSVNKGTLNETKLRVARSLVKQLEKDVHFEIDAKRREINLTETGYERVTSALGKSLYDEDDPWILEILNALKARHVFVRDKDYIVLNNKVLIVDEFTGRIMEDRRWSFGIHEAIESKENVPIGAPTETKSSITYQNFFPLYPKLAGMTGTAVTASREFEEIYNLSVVEIPTTKPMIRYDFPDAIYQTQRAKWKAVLRRARECYNEGQPILIGTASVEKSELLSALFTSAQIPHQVLNAKPENVARESEIIGQAGKASAVTIATNLAGRGTDILLGGNIGTEVKRILSLLFFDSNVLQTLPEWKDVINTSEWVKLKDDVLGTCFKGQIPVLIQTLPGSVNEAPETFGRLVKHCTDRVQQIWQIENQHVKEAGGLFVLGTERYETRRIDNQLRGRAGRQGDPGASQFFLSLEDTLLEVFGGDTLKTLVGNLVEDPDESMEARFLTEALERAQKKVEDLNYDVRKNIFQYDSILNKQRQQFFKMRYALLRQAEWSELELRLLELSMDKEWSTSFTKGKDPIDCIVNSKRKPLPSLTEWTNSQVLTSRCVEPSTCSLPVFLSSYVTDLVPNSPSKHVSALASTVTNRLKRKTERKRNTPVVKNKKTLTFVESLLPLDRNFKSIEQSWEITSKQLWIDYDQFLAHAHIYHRYGWKRCEKPLLFSLLDSQWTKHLERMSFLRETINWKAYGQQDPLFEYNEEASKSFAFMFREIRCNVVSSFTVHPLLIN